MALAALAVGTPHCTLLESAVEVSPALHVPQWVFQQGRCLSVLCRIPELGCAGCDSTHSLPEQGSTPVDFFSLQIPPRGMGPDPVPFGPSYLVTRRSFLQIQLFQSCSSSKLVFHENCSTGRCLFDVLVRGGEFHVLLLCHLDPPPQIILW